MHFDTSSQSLLSSFPSTPPYFRHFLHTYTPATPTGHVKSYLPPPHICTILFLCTPHDFYYLHPPRPTNLNNLARPRVIRSQHRPARPIRLVQLKLELRPHNLERASRGIDRREQRHIRRIPLLIRGVQIELDVVCAELDGAGSLVDLLEEKRRDHRGGRLVEIGPAKRQLPTSRINGEGSVVRPSYLTLSTTSSAPSSFFCPTKRCLSLVAHPSIFMNSSNSSTRRLQQLYPLLPSWKMGKPGWCTHPSSRLPTLASYVAPHALRLQAAPSGMGSDGSSSASSCGAGDFAGGGAACACCWVGRRGGSGDASGTSDAAGLGSGAGVSSMSVWAPVVQGGMARNSSKVRTRGLQHFQPGGRG